ncbi:MAG TPA: cation diffusion facilitator family transporter [Paenalcaligenes sp.]|nr:cation diffusion facilitator family transporter [Paenalcaligenes sp.]
MKKISQAELERHTVGKRSTIVSVFVNILLTVLQLVIGIFAKSQALVADALHSLTDLVSDGIVLIANKHSQKAPDADHPYGHYRFETAATLAIGLLLLSVAVGMLWNSISNLQTPSAIPTVHPAALVIALIALCSKELLFRYLLRMAKRVRSTMLAANAWHARSDAASSLVVAVGIIANLMGLPLADPLAAMIVALMIFRTGLKFTLDAFHDLTDRAVDDQTEAKIRDLMLSTPGVAGLHDLKTRKLGDMIWVEVDLEMDGTLTIEQGHEIGVQARQKVLDALPVLDVMIHFDPVDVKDTATLAQN